MTLTNLAVSLVSASFVLLLLYGRLRAGHSYTPANAEDLRAYARQLIPNYLSKRRKESSSRSILLNGNSKRSFLIT